MKRLAARTKLFLFAFLLLVVVFADTPASNSVQTAVAADPARTVFVHLFEWKWSDIAQECETFLGPMGFSAVQVSPPQEHRLIDASESGDGTAYPWWQRYQPVSYLIESRSGSRAEFDDMVQRCAAVGVDIYVDAVINHMAGLGDGVCDTGSAGTTICQGSGVANSYPTDPGNYSPWDFHMDGSSANHCGYNIGNWGSAWEVQNCELLGLDDLDTGEAYVQSEIAAYLNDLVLNLGVAGFRIDAAKHINEGELGAIMSQVGGTPYVFQEVIQDSLTDGGNYTFIGDVTEFRYSQEVGNRFRYGSINALHGLENWWLGSADAVVFTDNHDNQRGHGGGGNVITHESPSEYKLANIFMLAYPYGYPKVMSSYDFNSDGQGPPSDGGGNTNSIYSGGQPVGCSGGGWICEHRWQEIANMVAFRNHTADNFYVTDWWDNGYNQIAFGRGDKGFVVINREGYALNRTFQTSLAAGTYCNVIDGQLSGATCTGSTIIVNGDGTASISLPAMSAAAIHVGAVAGGCQSGCGGYQSSYNQVYFRGTPNGWGTLAMSLVADYTWEVDVTFSGASNDRFKFDIYGDWSLNFGDNNGDGIADQGGGDIYISQGAGDYTITFNDSSKAYTVTKNGGGGCSTVTVNFNVHNATTYWGQSVYVVGSVPELGSWNTANAVLLSPDSYPTWSGAVGISANTAVEYKYIKKDGSGNVTWQSGANQSLTTPCTGSMTTNDNW